MFILRKPRDFARFGIVGYKDDTGIGRQCHNMKAVLGIGYHLVAPSTRLSGHPLGVHDRSLPRDAGRDYLVALLHDLDGLIVIERNKWHDALFVMARKLNKKVIVVPNWEWFDQNDPAYRLVDAFVTHSGHALKLLTRTGFSNVVRLPPPIDLSLLPRRTITSPALKFFHNAGIIDHSDRKGTSFTLQAWQNKRQSAACLTVRVQKSDMQLPQFDGLRNVVFECGSKRNVEELYLSGDCAIQPSRLEGLGYMVLEPILCGIPTITTDAPPMNEWPQGIKACRAHESGEKSIPRARGIGSAPLFDVSIRSLTAQIEEAEQHDISELAKGAQRLRAEFAHHVVRARWCEALKHI
jgi:glycosyltransferase involved in cell wall biosynthesis